MNNYLIKNIYKITTFSLPIIFGMVITMVASFIAMMMVAKLGKVELAAGALGVTTFITVMTVVSTIFYAMSILISHHRGQNKATEEIGRIVKNGFWLAILLYIPSSLILWNIDKVLIFFKQDPQLILITHDYFHFAALVMLPTLIGSVIMQFFTGIGKPRFTLITSMSSLPFIVFFAYCFVLGNFGFPKLGLAGVTCSTFIVQSIMCILLLSYMFFNKSIRSYKIFSSGFLPELSLCKNIFTLGLPIGIQFGAELAAMSVATYFMGFYGVNALAAAQIVSQYSMLVVMVILGLSQGLSVLVSGAFGRKDIELVKQYIISANIVLAIFFTFIFTFFIIFPLSLIKLYVNLNMVQDADLIQLAIYFFALAAIMLLVDGVRNLLSGSLRGLHDSKAPMRIGVICLWVISLPMSYFSGFILNGGPIGLRIGFLTGFFMATILLWIRIQKKIRFLVSEQKLVPEY